MKKKLEPRNFRVSGVRIFVTDALVFTFVSTTAVAEKLCVRQSQTREASILTIITNPFQTFIQHQVYSGSAVIVIIPTTETTKPESVNGRGGAASVGKRTRRRRFHRKPRRKEEIEPEVKKRTRNRVNMGEQIELEVKVEHLVVENEEKQLERDTRTAIESDVKALGSARSWFTQLTERDRMAVLSFADDSFIDAFLKVASSSSRTIAEQSVGAALPAHAVLGPHKTGEFLRT